LRLRHIIGPVRQHLWALDHDRGRKPRNSTQDVAQMPTGWSSVNGGARAGNPKQGRPKPTTYSVRLPKWHPRNSAFLAAWRFSGFSLQRLAFNLGIGQGTQPDGVNRKRMVTAIAVKDARDAGCLAGCARGLLRSNPESLYLSRLRRWTRPPGGTPL
jgi:hypothetical protein